MIHKKPQPKQTNTLSNTSKFTVQWKRECPLAWKAALQTQAEKLCTIPDTMCFDPVNTCGICCPPKGMELGGVADTAVVGGNRGLICIPPRAIGAVIIFEDRGTTDKSNRKTRNAVHWQDEKHMQPPGTGEGGAWREG